jgi:hypothetical protein
MWNKEVMPEEWKELITVPKTDRSNYRGISRDQNAGWSHGIKIDNSSFKRVEELKKYGKKLIKSKFYS